ncbi:MAG: hypothetical protein ACRCX8_06530 [Sarcina sp.]
MVVSNNKEMMTNSFHRFMINNLKELNEIANKKWRITEYSYVDDYDKPGVIETATIRNEESKAKYKAYFFHNDSQHIFTKVD